MSTITSQVTAGLRVYYTSTTYMLVVSVFSLSRAKVTLEQQSTIESWKKGRISKTRCPKITYWMLNDWQGHLVPMVDTDQINAGCGAKLDCSHKTVTLGITTKLTIVFFSLVGQAYSMPEVGQSGSMTPVMQGVDREFLTPSRHHFPRNN